MRPQNAHGRQNAPSYHDAGRLGGGANSVEGVHSIHAYEYQGSGREARSKLFVLRLFQACLFWGGLLFFYWVDAKPAIGISCAGVVAFNVCKMLSWGRILNSAVFESGFN